MKKEKRLHDSLMTGLAEGIRWTEGEETLCQSRIEAATDTLPLPSSDIYTPLRLSYDEEQDWLLIRLSDAPVEESYETEPGVFRELDSKGGLVTLSIPNLRARLKHTEAEAETATPASRNGQKRIASRRTRA